MKNIRRYFTQCASSAIVGLSVFGTAFSAQAAGFSEYVPDGVIPSYVQDYYSKVFVDLGTPPTGKMPLRNTFGNTDFPLLPHMAGTDNPFINQLDAASPEEAEQMAWDYIQENDLLTDSTNLSSQEKLRLVVSLQKALRFNGVSEEEKPYFIHFQNNFIPPEDYQIWEANKIEQILRDILDSEELNNAIAEWKHQANYVGNQTEAEKQYYLRQNLAQKVSDIVRRHYDLDSIPVFIDRIPDYLPIGAVAASEEIAGDGRNFIVVNYKQNEAEGMIFANSIAMLLAVLLEEAKHSVDQEFVRMLNRGEIGRDDVRFEHTVAVNLNGHAYAIVDMAECFRNPQGTACIKNTNDYNNQYVESNAKELARLLTVTLVNEFPQDQKFKFF